MKQLLQDAAWVPGSRRHLNTCMDVLSETTLFAFTSEITFLGRENLISPTMF